MSGALASLRGLHSVGALSSAFQKGPDANERRARLLGTDRAELSARRIEGHRKMVRRARISEAKNVLAPTNVLPVTERDAALEFSAVIIPFSVGDLARAGKRTKDAAKKWKDASALPSAWSMMNLAREIPAVRNYVLAKLGGTSHLPMNSPQGMDALVQAVQALATMPGPEGERLRALLSGKAKY